MLNKSMCYQDMNCFAFWSKLFWCLYWYGSRYWL